VQNTLALFDAEAGTGRAASKGHPSFGFSDALILQPGNCVFPRPIAFPALVARATDFASGQ